MRSAVDATEADGSSLESLLGTFRLQIEPALNEDGIELVWEVDQLTDSVQSLGHEKHLNILRIAQEALSNVVRHSNATQVTVNVFSSAAKLFMSIVDNGQGFSPNSVHNGKGLKNFDFRSLQLGGTLKVASTPKGTHINLEVPLG
jgi:signal transduction histidine kinase